jgi:hypothetical protein
MPEHASADLLAHLMHRCRELFDEFDREARSPALPPRVARRLRDDSELLELHLQDLPSSVNRWGGDQPNGDGCQRRAAPVMPGPPCCHAVTPAGTAADAAPSTPLCPGPASAPSTT